MNNYIYIEELDTYLLKSSIEYLTIKRENVTASIVLGNGRSNYTIKFNSHKDAEDYLKELLTGLSGT